MVRSSLLYWWPRIRSLAIPKPRTEIVPFDERAFRADARAYSAECAREVAEAVVDLELAYPIFLKADEAASKHRYRDTCFVPDEAALADHIYEVAADNIFFDLTVEAMVVREFIDLDSRFTAFAGMPVAPERRYFVEDGRVLCWHNYWFENAIEFYGEPEPDGWRAALTEINTESADERKCLARYATWVAGAIEGAWSVDFAKGRNGVWYLIDMAEACVSWHPSDCPAFDGHGIDNAPTPTPTGLDDMLVLKTPTGGN
jgi:hypothetical protein